MPLGESVGTAYVRLIADGDGVPDDIKDSLDKLEPTLRDAGAEHASAYDKAYEKQHDKNWEKFQKKVDKDLEKSLGKFAANGRIIGDEWWDSFERKVSERVQSGSLASQLRTNLQRDFARSGGDVNKLTNQIRNLGGEIFRAEQDLDRLGQQIGRETERRSREMTRSQQELEREIRKTINETDQLAGSTERLLESTRRLADDKIRQAYTGLARITKEIGDQTDRTDGVTNRFQRRLIKINDALDRSATRTGRLFGKGARNDFVNLIGSMIEGLNRVIILAPKAAEKLTGIFTGQGGGGGGGGGFIKLAGTAASSIAGIGIAITALVAILGPVAALISGIGAAIIAMAGSLGFALGAVGGVAAGLTGVLVPAIGVALLAFADLGDAATKAIGKIQDGLADLANVAGEAIGPGLTKAAETLAPVFHRLTPLVEDTAGAIGNVIASLAQVADSPAFRKFTNAFETFLPRAVNQLGEAVGQLAEGLLGVFRAAIPITQEFLDWLVKITREFSEWANSRKGQNQLKNFFDEAAESAKIVGGLVADLVEAVAELLSQGKDTGDNIFSSLADNVRQFIDYLRNPKNADAIADFFKNGEQVAKDIGQLVLDIADLIGDFDTEKTRKELHALFGVIGDVIDVVGELSGLWETLADNSAIGLKLTIEDATAGNITARVLQLLGGPILIPLEFVFKQGAEAIIGKDWESKLGHIKSLFIGWAESTALSVVHGFAGLAKRITNAIGDVNWGKIISNPTGRVVGWFGGLAKRLTNAAGNFNWGGVITNFTPKVVGWFSGLAGRLARATGNFVWSTVIENYVPKIIGWFSGLAHRLVSAVGNFNWSSIINNPTDTIVGWFEGLADRINGLLHFSVSIDWPSPPSWLDKVTATGGIFAGAQTRIIGEAGPEAVVPLNRPLNMVDPSVRWLSAIAQGKQMAPGEGAPSPSGRSVVVEEGAITVVEAANGVATAQAVLNSLVARAV